MTEPKNEQAMTDILVVGGGGYIGSHTSLDLASKGFRPVVWTPHHDLASIVSSAWNWHARQNVE